MLVSVIVFVGINDGISVLSLYNRSHSRSSLFVIQPFIKAGLYNAVSGFEHYCLKTPLFDELINGLSGNTQDCLNFLYGIALFAYVPPFNSRTLSSIDISLHLLDFFNLSVFALRSVPLIKALSFYSAFTVNPYKLNNTVIH